MFVRKKLNTQPFLNQSFLPCSFFGGVRNFHTPLELEAAISAVLQRKAAPKTNNGADDAVAQARAHRRAGRGDKAESLLRRNLRADPAHAASLHELGLIAREKGRLDRAIQLFTKAVDAVPDAPNILCDLGLALKESGRYDEAIASQRRVTELLPHSALAWSNLGTALSAAGRFDDAIDAFAKALSIDPDTADFHYNLANARLALGDPTEAEDGFVRALDLSPGHAGALENLACALKAQGRLTESMDLLHGARALYPDNQDLRWNHALALLMAGEYRDGWAAYEARRAIPGFAIKPQRRPAWDGAALSGRRLLIHAEQGLGDTIQFCRYLHGFKGADGNIVCQVPSRLLPLMQSTAMAVEFTDADRAGAACDVQTPLLSLPHLLGPTEPFWPDTGAYLSPEPHRTAHWKDRLAGHHGPSVAVAWQGDPGYQADRTRSIPLAAFAPLADIPDLRLISLQQGPGRTQIAAQTWQSRLLDLGPEIDQDGAFLDSAAILATVGFLITSDTALAHLAGALGVPAWLALAHVPDWRWGLSGDRCGWYPSLRLFRQKSPGDWGPVFDQIAISINEEKPA